MSKHHPHYDNIQNLKVNGPSPELFLAFGRVKPSPVNLNKVKFVDTEEKLDRLVEDLEKVNIFAVDLEHNSRRSYLGLVSLMQISTATNDYIVDPLALHDKLNRLKPIFEDGSVCKVFHGSINDLEWLQRDFDIYVINLFDTLKACDALKLKGRSLKYLLEHYCDVFTDKKFQLADWRTRALAKDKATYAILDTHYLLYIAAQLVREAIADLNMFSNICQKSNDLSLNIYEKQKEISTASASQFIKTLDEPEEKIETMIKRICLWRDTMARLHDEGLKYTLDDHMVSKLGAAFVQGRKKKHIYSMLEDPSSVIKSHFHSLFKFVKTGNLNYITKHVIYKQCKVNKYSEKFLLGLKRNVPSLLQIVMEENCAKIKKSVHKKEPVNTKDPSSSSIYQRDGFCRLCSKRELLTKYVTIPPNLTKHFPTLYRRLFLKADTTFLCKACNWRAEQVTSEYFRKLEKIYNVSEIKETNETRSKGKNASEAFHVLTMDNAKKSLSESVRIAKEEMVAKYFQKENYTDVTEEEKKILKEMREEEVNRKKEKKAMKEEGFGLRLFQLATEGIVSDDEIKDMPEYIEAQEANVLSDEENRINFIRAARFVMDWRNMYQTKGLTFLPYDEMQEE